MVMYFIRMCIKMSKLLVFFKCDMCNLCITAKRYFSWEKVVCPKKGTIWVGVEDKLLKHALHGCGGRAGCPWA